MSMTSEELNYLIWRYFQESGNAVSALALQDETKVLEFDNKYKHLIPIGTLVNLVQKGILYTESELLVGHDGSIKKEDADRYGKDFNLVQALQIDKEKFPEIQAKGRFALEHEAEYYDEQEEEQQRQDEEQSNDGFIKTLEEFVKLDEIISCKWNPVSDEILACGGRDSVVTVLRVDVSNKNIKSKIELRHPFAPSSSAGKTTNEVTCLAWSPRGDEIVTGVENGELRLWNVEGKLQNIFNFHRGPIVAIEWNENATHFITTDVENITILWNAVTGTALQHFELRDQSSTAESLGVDIEWIEHDKFVLPGPQGSLMVFQMDEDKPIGKLLGHRGAIGVLEFNSHSRMLLSASDDHTLRIWRGGSCNSSNTFYGHSQSILAASWIDEDKVISASMDGSVRVWSHSDNALLAVSMADGIPIFAARLSKDKTKYAVGFMDGQITIYDVSQLVSQLRQSRSSRAPITIPIFGIFQNVKDANCVYDISWNHNSNEISVAYSKEGGSIISL
ncbi:hypothetical protein ZYGR_0I06750 [Zygosaccharomyces rouxii]|uniref:ZYRO0C15994p n=2 Tax=Zygosaccharomyces rouxii TaxID=4956 RepID=C5DUE0_ZYGRC|nr:uncharacterized protein ZYRO0C15994g [Zygosaccharomyces rouxii]KAH9201426.1 WD40-repeat-containing domain protein [Zygosaccharomyces rouxii]GAV48378.1 hypothetical protein ZYGR_0I06750 [Zygosaccharomyces rouxii]CAR27401.1 ZYRO0C15994p [Zygosaccharomyces rouxii]